MKALKNAGIDEATLAIGTSVNWWSKDFGMMGDAVSYIERDEDGTVTRIGFASWTSLFTNRMKLGVELHEGPSMYTDPMAQVGHWYALALADGRVRG